MKVLISVGSKKKLKLGIIMVVKWTIQNFTISRKHNPNIERTK
jgi:hypothetical protein